MSQNRNKENKTKTNENNFHKIIYKFLYRNISKLSD